MGSWVGIKAFADYKFKHMATRTGRGENLKKLGGQNIGGWILESLRIMAEVVFERLGLNPETTYLPTVCP